MVKVSYGVTRMVRRLSVLGAATFMLVGFLTPASAHADGTYRWKSAMYNGYLDVYKHSKSNGAIVVVAASSKNSSQLWRITKVSKGYYRVRNVRSGRALDRWNSTTAAGGPNEWGGNAQCDVTQWDWWGGAQQRWKLRKVWSKISKRYFYLWINQKGCKGDPYHDVLGTVPNYPNILLYTEDFCSEGAWIGKNECFWKKNGK